jgi:aconitate hydratase
VSPETAAVSAITGVLTDPETWTPVEKPAMPERFMADDSMVLAPSDDPDSVEVVRGPNIKPFPKAKAPAETIEGKVLIKLGDNITTDHIMPSNAKLLPYRSNVPYLSEFCLTPCDPDFPKRAQESGGGFIVAGQNYGQGSSREHAALAPLYLGVKGVIAIGFARIHRANLINNGILPLCLEDEADYAALSLGDEVVIANVHEQIAAAARSEGVVLKCGEREIKVRMTITPRQRDILLAGGLLNYTREQAGKEDK